MIPVSIAVEAVLLGIGTGFLAALAGFGGGFLYVPILILVFGVDPQDAVGTSLAVIIFTTLAASVSYLRQNKVFFRSAACLLPPSILGAVAGAYLTAFISGRLIEILFSLFVGLLAIKLIFQDFPLVQAIRKGPSFKETSSDTYSCVETTIYYLHYCVWGGLAGLASGLTGIGGGIFNVPALVTAGMPVHFAVATSSLAVLGTSCAGAFTHATLGHIQIVYAIPLSMGAIVGAYAGTRAAPKIPEGLLRVGIGMLLAVVAFMMLVSILTHL
ncbi:MAG: sulfite exporter TauE/SafE family protein [Methanoregulaceae archaeon]